MRDLARLHLKRRSRRSMNGQLGVLSMSMIVVRDTCLRKCVNIFVNAGYYIMLFSKFNKFRFDGERKKDIEKECSRLLL